MAGDRYEVTVIGGGIHGAGVMQAAAAAGYKTLVIEQRHWAAGTSSRSSKLLHGGLRYLETAQLSLVRQSLQERNRLLELAPTLAHPLQFHIPIYAGTTRRPWQLVLGLSLYAVLSGLSRLSRFSWHRGALAGLKADGLQKRFSYWDGQTDDALLTRAVVDSALSLGADALCPATLTAAERTADGYRLTVVEGDDTRHIHTDFLVNCAGPWINRVQALVSPETTQQTCELVKGSHLILQKRISDDAFYLESPEDKRAIFLLPWGEHSLLGTTEQHFEGDPQSVAVSPQERNYLLATARHYFPNADFKVIEEFAGLRVLPAGDASAFARPRECIFHSDPEHPRLLALYGGKLTTYRHTAEQVIKAVTRQLGPRQAIADTTTLPLSSPVPVPTPGPSPGN